eukprot:Gregarina_sp_Poly_1__2054@NODE_153_length_12491_cov_49_511993_g135_i0_p7_GENE_NODE_153_length_12491_cov_49_511993_g135_i0NODE_153_length_12491_cov_49_511993_g135_i0_p7_ORF_typecomplete_len105_score19_72_NODE_153_length_12491_cov_49_511993_g135_i01195412268
MHRQVGSNFCSSNEKLSTFFLLETILQILPDSKHSSSIPQSARTASTANSIKSSDFWGPEFSELFETLKKQEGCNTVWNRIEKSQPFFSREFRDSFRKCNEKYW